MVNILNIGFIDCAGVMSKWKRLFDKYSKKYTMRNLVELKSGLNYEIDLVQNSLYLKEIIAKTDIFIFHPIIKRGWVADKIINDGVDSKICGINWKECTKGKKVFALLHGSTNLRTFKQQYTKTLQEQYERIFCTTPDLKQLFPFTEYIPVPLDLNKEIYKSAKPRNKSNKGEIIIHHYPTDKAIKNTREFEEVCNELKKDYPKLKFKTITNMTNPQVIEDKKKIHLCFDHMQGYYGVNTLEAAAVGAVPLVGISKINSKIIKETINVKDIPFELVRTKEELKNTIKYYLDNPEEIKIMSKKNLEWMKKKWSPNVFYKMIEKQLTKKIKKNKDMLSIVMATCNRRENLRNAMYSIVNQDIPIPHELVIIDDGSTDGTKEMIEKFK